MQQTFIKNNRIHSFNIENSKVIATILINGVWVSNPTLSDFYASGWQDYTQPEPEPLDKDLLYKWRTSELIHNEYTTDDEVACIRQKETKSKEFNDYYSYCEACKKRAYEEVYGKEAPSNLAPKENI